MDGKWQCREDWQWVGLTGYLVRAWCLCGDGGRGLGQGSAVHGWCLRRAACRPTELCCVGWMVL